jgi:Zn-dependent peptidase ImmA (M78 family)
MHSNDPLHYDLNLVEDENEDRFLFRADNISSPAEMEANHFAAELLMPEEHVKSLIADGTTSIQDLADKFNVSPGAMKYRLINLGYL